jgi:hypothetical protein
MKNLIRTILKETIDNRIVDVLIKMNLPNYGKIEEFLKEAGYGHNEIKEINYSYFESISGLELTPMNWMNYYFSPNQLEVIEDYDSIFFRKNGKVVMEQDDDYKYFWFHYYEIWEFVESFFGMERHQTQGFLRQWVEETFKLEGYTPKNEANNDFPSWRRLSN